MIIIADSPRSITPDEFHYIGEFLKLRTGIRLVSGKETLVMGRLERRLRHLGLTTYGEYFDLLTLPGSEDELRTAVDLLTTNETYFFREQKHFDYLRDVILPDRSRSRPFRLWSAASSSGEEAYTAAMVVAEAILNDPWEISGTDVSSRVVTTARRGVYPIAAAEKIPGHLLKRYCRKGKDEYEGLLAVCADLRSKVSFSTANLLEPLDMLGMFDVILLRNVMIYFERETKVDLIHRLQNMLCPGGYLIVSLSETLNGIPSRLRMVEPSIYRLERETR